MQTFAIAPVTSSRPLIFFAVIGCVLLGSLLLLAASAFGPRTARFDVSDAGLRLRGDIYGRTIPRAALQLESARQVNLAEERGLRPAARTMGTALPGYRSGWFRLGSGEKALLYLTDETRAVYIPTTAGYSVLVSPADPVAFLQALRGRGPTR